MSGIAFVKIKNVQTAALMEKKSQEKKKEEVNRSKKEEFLKRQKNEMDRLMTLNVFLFLKVEFS